MKGRRRILALAAAVAMGLGLGAMSAWSLENNPPPTDLRMPTEDAVDTVVPAADPVPLPQEIAGVDAELLKFFTGNPFVQSDFQYALPSSGNPFAESLRAFSQQEKAVAFLREHASFFNETDKKAPTLQNLYADTASFQYNYMRNTQEVTKAVYPLLEKEAFYAQAEQMSYDPIEACVRYIYSQNNFLSSLLSSGDITPAEAEEKIAALIEKERRHSYLAILYLDDDSLFPEQNRDTDAFRAFLYDRYDDSMYQLELLLSYDTAMGICGRI